MQNRTSNLKIETLRGLTLAREYFQQGILFLKSKNDLHLFVAVNLLQDASEAYLIAMANHLGVSLDFKSTFDKYFVEIDKKINPASLPMKQLVLKLNTVRVSAKHHGIQPDRSECERLAISLEAFFDDVTRTHTGLEFRTVSGLALLEEGPVKTLLEEAKTAIESGDCLRAALACRKATYLQVEKSYDVSAFKERVDNAFFGPFSSAPHYAQSVDYIDRNVREPTDFIVLDHSRVDQELLKIGLDPSKFWNIWRLTPSVYQTAHGTWEIKIDLDKSNPDALATHIEYIFNAALDISLAFEANNKKFKRHSGQLYELELAREGVRAYTKADKSTQTYTVIPKGVKRVSVQHSTSGLNDNSTYWHIMHIAPGVFVGGYIHQEDVLGIPVPMQRLARVT
jgi:hypothetical protein